MLILGRLLFIKGLTLWVPTPENGQHTQMIRGQKPKNRLSVFDQFVGLALKGSKDFHRSKIPLYIPNYFFKFKCNLMNVDVLWIRMRSSRSQMFFKIGVLKIHWKTPVLESFFDKVADPRKFH